MSEVRGQRSDFEEIGELANFFDENFHSKSFQ